MERVYSSDKSSSLGGGGYFASLEEMNTPRHQSMHALLASIKARNPRKFISALRGVEKAGWDINQVVFQDSLDSWYMLGAYLASQPTLSMGKMFSAYLDYPGVDLASQKASVHLKYRSYYMRGKDAAPEAFAQVHANTIVPITHAFLRQWAQHLPPPPKLPRDATQYQVSNFNKKKKLHQVATELFEKISAMDPDWRTRDEHGNGLCHVLIERESSYTLDHLLPWLKKLGVSMASNNDAGISPSVAAQYRIARTKANGNDDQKQLNAFKNTLSILERDLLDEYTPPATSPRPSRRF